MSYAISRAEQIEQQYCDMLDMDGPVTIAGVSFDPSRVLREMDPIAYDVGLADYMDLVGFDSDEDEDYESDGQPDEAQEWADFDPDC
jgi:hypothetical protein